jgi:hypothetical protein
LTVTKQTAILKTWWPFASVVISTLKAQTHSNNYSFGIHLYGSGHDRLLLKGVMIKMTALEAWNKYQHLNLNLSDRELLPDSFWGSIIFDLWQAIKNEIKKEG